VHYRTLNVSGLRLIQSNRRCSMLVLDSTFVSVFAALEKIIELLTLDDGHLMSLS